jgi:hypothetical protein
LLDDIGHGTGFGTAYRRARYGGGMSTSRYECNCDCFEEGDWVESKLNPEVFGIVIGESDFGRFYSVQLVGSLEVRVFFAVTIRHAEPPARSGGAKQPIDDDNVIDFTKERLLRKITTTRGAA